MKIEDYFNSNDQKRLKDKEYIYSLLKKPYIVAGMLEFTEETKHFWAGPFCEKYAFYRLTDESESNHIKHYTDANRKDAALEYIKKNKIRESEIDRVINHFMNEGTTVDRPYRLYMCGNDDASYTRCFATKSEALDFINLMEGCQPLNANIDIYPLFAFTN